MTDVATHYAARVAEAHQRLDAQDMRIQSLERNEAVAKERSLQIQASLTKIETNLGRVVWLLVTGFAGAIITFIVRGGLHGIQ